MEVNGYTIALYKLFQNIHEKYGNLLKILLPAQNPTTPPQFPRLLVEVVYIIVVFVMVIFVIAHCHNVHNIASHGATAAEALISLSAVVQEGSRED